MRFFTIAGSPSRASKDAVTHNGRKEMIQKLAAAVAALACGEITRYLK